ncbi:MAG: biotin/lipoyl-binding protein, partial [Singulisphaera sp.]
ARGEVLGAGAGGRVVEVHFREGDAVRRGDVLIRLDTERLDNVIVKKVRAIKAAEEELAKLNLLEGLQARQHEVSVAKAEAELAQAEEIVRRALERRDADVRLARLGAEGCGRRGGHAPQAVVPGCRRVKAASGRGEDPRGEGEVGFGPDLGR